METITIANEGLLRGIPTYDKSINNLVAVVSNSAAGANGISGNAMVEWLATHGDRWKTVHAISRRPPPKAVEGKDVRHHAIDLLGASPESLAEEFTSAGIEADYVFHFAYTDASVTSTAAGSTLWSETDGLVRNNTHMLAVTIEALCRNHKHKGSKKVRRVMLQTGTKHYGFHLGPILSPGTEGDPLVEYEANFYYAQEQAMQRLAKQYDYEWNTVRPSFIIGTPKEVNSLNAAMAYALYIALCKEMGQDEVAFPGTFTAYNSYCDQSYDLLNASFEEWAVLTPEAANEDFNIQNGDVYTWSRGWPRLTEYYGVKAKKLTGEEPNEAEQVFRTPSPRDGTESTLKNRMVVAKWATQPEVRQAFERLQKKHNLQSNVFDKTWWPLLDFLFGIQWDCNMSMTKARELGFHGYCDSHKAHLEMFKRAESLGLLPPPSD